MAPARNLLRRSYDSYGGLLFLDPRWEEKVSVASGLMAEDQARREAADQDQANDKDDDIGVVAVVVDHDHDQSSKGSWLQLGRPSRRPVVELNLFPDRHTPSTTTTSGAAAGNVRPTIAPRGSGRSTYAPPGSSSSSGRELRVISPPRGRRTGLWFELKAARDQGKEPFLPQIPKSYLRIKDESMTVGLLMKYLANKLVLDGESQVEIAYRGQRLHPTVKLQHIRDDILRTRSTAPAMSPQDLQISDHVMTLIYCRRA